MITAFADAVSTLGHIDYACEHDDRERAAYRVTGHEGQVAHCFYCAYCAALASCDWNGETAKCEAVQ